MGILHELLIDELFHIIAGLRINGHSKHRSALGYESASILSSDIETSTFLESDDDASSRITSTTGRHTNMSSAVDRTTLGKLSNNYHLFNDTLSNDPFTRIVNECSNNKNYLLHY